MGKGTVVGARQALNTESNGVAVGKDQQGARGRGVRKRRSLRVQVAAGVGVLVAGVSIIGAAPSQSTERGGLEPVSAAYQVEIIQSGDSLWSVAQRVNAGEDPRVVVERLKQLNDLGGAVLQPGQVLRVE